MTIFYVTVSVGGGLVTEPDPNAEAALRALRRRTLRANAERLVNYFRRPTAPGAEKGGSYLEQSPGLTRLLTLVGPIRGAWWTGYRLFVVGGNGLYEVFSDWSNVLRGTLITATGRVDFAQGLFQLMMVDGPSGYVFTLASNAFAQISDADFYGSNRVGFLDGKFIVAQPGTQKFNWSDGIDQAADYDGSAFASAESSPDNIVCVIVDHREVWLFGEKTTEVYFSSPNADTVYIRNNGASIEMGCAAAHSAQQLDNSIIWLASDRNGSGMVVRAGGSSGYQPERLSSGEVEESLAKSANLSLATAMVWQIEGQSFYALKVPDLETVWVYEVSTKLWHEMAEVETNGTFAPWRADIHVFAFGKRIVGDAEGKLYELDVWANTFDGDVMSREWITPHQSSPNRVKMIFDELKLDATYGITLSGLNPMIELRYFDDAGFIPSPWMARSLGKIGEFWQQAKWNRLGSGRDRVWHFRCTDNAKAAITGYKVKSRETKT